MNPRFVVAVGVLSAVAALAVATLAAAARTDSPILYAVGVALILIAAVALAALIRAIVINERRGGS